MQLTFDAKELKNAFAALNTAFNRRTTAAILTNVKMLLDENGVATFTTTNLDLLAQVYLPPTTADQVLPLSYCFDFETAYTFVKGKAKAITFTEYDYKTLTIANDAGFDITLPLVDAESYPHVKPESEGDFKGIIENFGECVQNVAFAAASDETRPVLTGVSIASKTNGELWFAAADSVRLQTAKADVDVSKMAPIKTILPAASLSKISKFLPKAFVTRVESKGMKYNQNATQAERLASTNGNMIEVTIVGYWLVNGHISFYLMEIEGNFPNYEQIIPKAHDVEIVCNTTKLQEVLKFVAVNCLKGKTPEAVANSLRFDAMGDGGYSYIYRTKQGEWSSPKLLQGCTVMGEPVSFALNQAFLSQALATVKAENVTIRFAVSKHEYAYGYEIKPIEIWDGSNVVRVIMPLYMPIEATTNVVAA